MSTERALMAIQEGMSTTVALPAELTIDELVARTKKVQQAMVAVMRPGEHYGIIPGTQKPTLLKPGAEKLLTLFMLDPQYDDPMMTYEGNHLTVVSRCTLYHIPTGRRVGSGLGSCSTKEARYAYRQASRACPACGVEAIIKGKTEFGGGWVCFKKKGGCGAKYKDEDVAITSQPVGRVPNEDLPDQYNTVLKMSNKRGLTAAVLNVTAASDIFTQDMEDTAGVEEILERGASPVEDAGRGISDRPEPSTAAPSSEAPEWETDESETMRSILRGEITAIADKMKMPTEARRVYMRQLLGDVKIGDATLDQLKSLHDSLLTTLEAKQGKR